MKAYDLVEWDRRRNEFGRPMVFGGSQGLTLGDPFVIFFIYIGSKCVQQSKRHSNGGLETENAGYLSFALS